MYGPFYSDNAKSGLKPESIDEKCTKERLYQQMEFAQKHCTLFSRKSTPCERAMKKMFDLMEECERHKNAKIYLR